jgi:response regulator RpfG family c-di-GMP phosphodiesterase
MNRLTERHVVVVVDDEPAVLSALRRSLRQEPYQILATAEPEQALRWVESRDVSAVISDQRMPRMAGTELLNRVGERSPATARIILTAHPGPTAGTPGLKRSIECLIEKPWDDAMLRRTIRGFLSEREWEDRADP